jgi:hypothetical protein
LQFPKRSFGPPPLFFLLWHMLCSAPLQHRCLLISASLTTSCRAPPPRVDPSPSAALAPLFWPPARLPRPPPLLPELPLSDSSPLPWQMPTFPSLPSPSISYRELLWFKPFPFRSFSLFRAHTETRTPPPPPPSTPATPLLAVGSPLQSTPHYYDPLGSFPSSH